MGCGKTTLIENCIQTLKLRNKIFYFSGDDTVFRTNILTDSKYLYELIRGQTQEQVLIYIDEVQKCEEIFDSLKFIFDKGKAHFIVSGSNPEFLQTVAKKRLQRRADFKILSPLSLPEVLFKNKPELLKNINIFNSFLSGNEVQELPQIELTPKMKVIIQDYLKLGGFPLSYLAVDERNSLLEIQKAFDRGFEPIRSDLEKISDVTVVELAHLHSNEFTYSEIFNKTRIKQRNTINEVIHLLNAHGYLGVVSPMLMDEGKKSYLKKYFFTDPGLVTYLTGTKDILNNKGFLIEGLVYSRLQYKLQFELTKNKNLYYFKNYILKSDGAVRFLNGEVDAVYQVGSQLIPIEVKSTENWNQININPLLSFMKNNNCSLGIVLYGGGTVLKKEKILFWPYWMI